mmetsp:Transcript_40723/g.81652  ORF Transcript_40723/g.81652 Transcript_40723/m.81652 type:complete len:1137 (-) Transcript_40723:107-3517(-)
MQHFARPENALKRAEEFLAVGQKDAALVGMYDVLSSKRHRTWQPSMELVMMRYLELCVEMRKAKAAKDGLIQYRMVCQQINIASMETVLRHFMGLADTAAEEALSKAEEITGQNMENLLDFDDLEAEETPESLMMATVGGGADSKKRTDRQVVTPSLKFLWEAYRTVLDVLRNNSKLDDLYRDTCLKAFGFCLKYKRAVEFRRLCEILRNHIQAQTKLDPKWKEKEPPTAEAMQTHLETRFSQLNTAIEMELWQEAYRTVEDVHSMIGMMKLRPKAKPMAAYHSQLAKIFWVAGNVLFHGMSLVRLYALSKTFATPPPPVELSLIASRAVLAALATPAPSPVVDVNLLEYDLEHEKTKRMAAMLSFPTELSRDLMLSEVRSKGLLAIAMPEVRELFLLTEASFFPLDLAKKATPLLEKIAQVPALEQYDEALRKLVGLRLLQQMERVYLTISIDKVKEAISVLPWSKITDLILWAAKRDLVTLRIDEKLGQLRQRAAQANAAMSVEVRDTLAKFGTSLEAVFERLRSADIQRTKAERSAKLYGNMAAQLEEDHQKILARRLIIERRKEEAERVTMEEDKERKELKRIQQEEEEAHEKARLKADATRRDADREASARADEEAAQSRKIAEQMAEQRKNMKVVKQKKVTTDVDTLATKSRAELMSEQRALILDERAEFETRLESMARRHDHMERARRQEERELLQLNWEAQQKEDRKAHEARCVELRKERQESRAHDIKEKERFGKMSDAAASFRSRCMAKREEEHKLRVEEWKAQNEEIRKERERAKAEALAREREREAELERARLEAEEEEARRIQAEADAKAKREQEEEERKRVEERQRKKEQELEEKARKEKLDAQTARLAEREKKGRSWATEDDEMDFEKESSLKAEAEKTAEAKDKEEGERQKNQERWEGHALSRDGPGGGGAAGGERGGGDRWESRGGPRGGDRDGPPRGGFDRDAPRGGFDRGGDRGPPARGGFDRDGPPRGGFDRDGPPRGGGDRGGFDRGDRGGFDRGDRGGDRGPPRAGDDDRWNRDPRSGPRDAPPPRGDDRGPPARGGFDRDGPPRSGFDRDGPRGGGKGDGPPRGGFDRDGPPRSGFGGDRGKGDGPPRRDFGGRDNRDRPREGGGADSGGWRR